MGQPRRVGEIRLSPAARPAVTLHLHLTAANGDLSQRTDGVHRVQKGRLVAAQFGRQAQLDLEAVAQAGSDRHALCQQPGSAVENGDRAARPRVEAGRVDDQHRRAATAQKSPPCEMDRLARPAALGETRLLHAPQPLQRRQRLGLREAGQRVGEGPRRRHGARQGGGARVEPSGQAHGPASPSPGCSATT